MYNVTIVRSFVAVYAKTRVNVLGQCKLHVGYPLSPYRHAG